MIETKRLILHRLSKEHGAGFQEIFDHPDFYYLGAISCNGDGHAYLDKRLALQNFNADSKSPISASYAVILKSEDKVIGYQSAGDNHLLPEMAKYGWELGSFIHSDHQRKGYATEAREAMLKHLQDTYGQKLFYSTVDPENIASVSVLKKCGFEKKEELRGDTITNIFKGPRDIYTLKITCA